jgi:hypothetical protein
VRHPFRREGGRLDRIGPYDHCALPQGYFRQTGTALFCGSPISSAFATIDALERGKPSRLSRMQRTVAAMGGHLTLIAIFPDQEPVVLVTGPVVERAKGAGRTKARTDAG